MYFWWAYRPYRTVGYRYLVRTELTELSGTGVKFVPNHTGVLGRVSIPVPNIYRYPRYCGRGYTGTRGYIWVGVPDLPKWWVPVSN